jgi:DNA-binding response OmpR family regulator|tara:strand:- start:1628 stop:2326 length:699 start_codon:yes stop_codon:yes gene_type:complete
MKSNKRILLVEDDPNFGRILKDYLTINNYEVSLAVNGIEGFEKFNRSEFDLCILDIMMPFKDGLTLAREIKEVNDSTPLIFLTAKNLKDDVLKGYKIGADDYLTKPFDSEILLAKIKSILNRKPIIANDKDDSFEFKFGEFNFNSKLRILTHKEGVSNKLSPKENQLLKMLVLNFDDLLPRDIALNKIWRDANYFTSRSMDVYIAKLRKYLEKDVSLKIINVHGEGFRLMKN